MCERIKRFQREIVGMKKSKLQVIVWECDWNCNQDDRKKTNQLI